MKLTPLQHAERALEKEYFAQCKRYAKPIRSSSVKDNEGFDWARYISALAEIVDELGGSWTECSMRARRKYDRITGLPMEEPICQL